MDDIEFEDEAPIELTDRESSLEDVSKIEISSEKKEVDIALEKAIAKDRRKERMKENPKPLVLKNHSATKVAGKPKLYGPKDVVTIHCNICNKDMEHGKHEDDGSFTPFALCQHVVFKGVTTV